MSTNNVQHKQSGRNCSSNLSFITALSLLAASVLTVVPIPRVVRAEPLDQRPYAVFVNGFLDCCAWNIKTKPGSQGMTQLQQRLAEDLNVEIRQVPYSNFIDKGTHIGAFGEMRQTKVELKDKKFIEQGAKFINTELDPDRPLILIGHSFGGDSVLRLLPEINRTRKILFVGVIDPVADFGLRSSLRSYKIPRNVDYFFNRWQKNGFPPADYQKSGRIFGCQAQVKCDQDDFSFRDIALIPQQVPPSKSDKTITPNPKIYDRNFLCNQLEQVRIPKRFEFLCPKGIQSKALPANAVAHSDLPVLPEIQQEIGDILANLLGAPQTNGPKTPTSSLEGVDEEPSTPED